MTHFAPSLTSRITAAMNREVDSPRNQSATQVHVAREMGMMAQRDSTTQFDELQRLYSTRLFKTILRITKNWEDAEDVLQETFLRAYMALHSFEGRSSVYSWLTRIAINSALMTLRRRRSRPETFLISSFEDGDGYFPIELKDSSANPEQLYDQRQRKNSLLRTIRSLDSSLRVPIEAQLTGEHSVKDIADTLNISVAATKSRLYRARARLAIKVSTRSGKKKCLPIGIVDDGCFAADPTKAGKSFAE